MKVLMINGSPHLNGTTNAALEIISDVLKNEDIDSEIVSLAKENVNDCIACGRCGSTGKCVFNDIVNDVLFVKIIFFRKQNILRTICYATPECDISGISSHYLDDTASLMRGGGVLYLVDGLHCRVYRSVKADGILCTGNVQVNGARKSYGVDAQSGQGLRSSVGAVSSDDHNAVDPMLFADFSALLLPLRCFEFQTACRSQNCTASLDNVGNIARFHIYNLFI